MGARHSARIAVGALVLLPFAEEFRFDEARREAGRERGRGPAASASSDVTIDSRGRTLLDAAREATLALAIELQRVGAEVTVVALRSFGRTVLLKASWLLQHRDVLQRIAVDHQQVGIGLRGHRPFGLHTARDTVGLAISASIATAAIPASGIAGPDVLRRWGRVVETVLSR